MMIHNDHVWVLFYDGNVWQLYDSELDIIGLNDFIIKRLEKVSPFFLEILLFGPPFIIWAANGGGLLSSSPDLYGWWSPVPPNVSCRSMPKLTNRLQFSNLSATSFRKTNDLSSSE